MGRHGTRVSTTKHNNPSNADANQRRLKWQKYPLMASARWSLVASLGCTRSIAPSLLRPRNRTGTNSSMTAICPASTRRPSNSLVAAFSSYGGAEVYFGSTNKLLNKNSHIRIGTLSENHNQICRKMVEIGPKKPKIVSSETFSGKNNL